MSQLCWLLSSQPGQPARSAKLTMLGTAELTGLAADIAKQKKASLLTHLVNQRELEEAQNQHCQLDQDLLDLLQHFVVKDGLLILKYLVHL